MDNAGALTTDGCETGLEYRRGRLKAYLNYTYTRSLNTLDEQVPEIAPHGANVGIQYAFTPRLRLSLRGRYLGERQNSKIIPATGNDRIEAAFVLHSALTFALPRGIDFQLVVDNLLDARLLSSHPSFAQPLSAAATLIPPERGLHVLISAVRSRMRTIAGKRRVLPPMFLILLGIAAASFAATGGL